MSGLFAIKTHIHAVFVCGMMCRLGDEDNDL